MHQLSNHGKPPGSHSKLDLTRLSERTFYRGVVSSHSVQCSKNALFAWGQFAILL